MQFMGDYRLLSMNCFRQFMDDSRLPPMYYSHKYMGGGKLSPMYCLSAVRGRQWVVAHVLLPLCSTWATEGCHPCSASLQYVGDSGLSPIYCLSAVCGRQWVVAHVLPLCSTWDDIAFLLALSSVPTSFCAPSSCQLLFLPSPPFFSLRASGRVNNRGPHLFLKSSKLFGDESIYLLELVLCGFTIEPNARATDPTVFAAGVVYVCHSRRKLKFPLPVGSTP
ncbi:hypothetical protein PoB_001408000 [Plakobranchus ocellatus]|uniref:Uncharacterized protein n=1 Tax=Plakobranchus ocellatus TaxID=259542 RepID=A0AAV3YWJ1_9GAST|nr:hypothetical protein PoB_001408000 [Plakobranchus ocellatus]